MQVLQLIFWSFFRKGFIIIILEWYYIKSHEVFTPNLMNCSFSKDSLQWLLSKEGNKPGRSKLEETEKAHTSKNAKNIRSFLSFLNFVKQFIPNYSHPMPPDMGVVYYAATRLNFNANPPKSWKIYPKNVMFLIF